MMPRMPRHIMPQKTGGIRYRSARGSRTVLLEQIKLTVILSLTGLMLIASETTLLSHVPVPFFGWTSASPALGLLFSMAVGFLHGEREGGITGLLCGWLMDASGAGDGIMLLPLLYLLCGYMSGTVGKRRLAHNLPSFMVFAIFGGGLHCLFSMGKVMLFLKDIPPVYWIWNGLMPTWLLTVIFSPMVYAIVWGEKKILEIKGRL